MNKVLWFFILAFAFSLMGLSGGSRATGPYEDSLYIVKPEADSLHWGSKVIGAAPVARTIRLLNHCPDTLIGVVYSTNACYTLNGTTKDTLQYLIPDTTGVFQFTVQFIPTYRGVINAWLYYSDPFDSTALYGAATGGTSPKPLGPSIFDHSPFSGSGEGVNAYGQKQPGYVNGIFPPMVYPGEGSMLDVSAGCLRASYDSIKVDADTTTGIFTSYTDSLTSQSIAWNIAGSNYSHATTASGLPENSAISVRVRVCRTNDASCCRDTTMTLITECGALSSPIDFEVILAPDSAGLEEPSDSGFVAYWDTRTQTDGNLRYYDTGVDTGWVYSLIFDGPAYSHAFWVPIVLEPSTTYYVSVDNWNACSEHLGWSDSLEFTTGADTSIVECPTLVNKSGISTEHISSDSEQLFLTTDKSVCIGWRYALLGTTDWEYVYNEYYMMGDCHDLDGCPALQHTITLEDLLPNNVGYRWETNYKYEICDTTAYADPDTFYSGCMTAETGSWNDCQVSASAVYLYCATLIDAKVGFRYKEPNDVSWTYLWDADADSTGHTKLATGLVSGDSTLYICNTAVIYGACDTTEWGHDHEFWSGCPTIVNSNFASQTLQADSATFHFHTSMPCKALYRYDRGFVPLGWTYVEDADSDSLQHTFLLTGLTYPWGEYKWQVRTLYAGCDSSAWANQQTFFTGCPTLGWTAKATQAVTDSSAVIHRHLNQAAHIDYRYGGENDEFWTYHYDTEADSTQRTDTLSGLDGSTDYVWESRYRSFEGCDTTAWGDSTHFTTLTACPTVTKSLFASQAITIGGATLHFHTSDAVHAGFRYHVTGNNTWYYRHDADADSTEHTISISGLSPAIVHVWESNTKYTGCDSTSYADSTDFTTACPTVTKSSIATQAKTATAATLHFHTDYAAHTGYRYHITGANPWTYTHDADADSLQHTVTLAGLTAASTYVWQSNIKYVGCDSVAYADSTQFKTTCATVVNSDFATQGITSTVAILHFHTDIASHAHYRRALYASSSYTYYHDSDADSVQHTKQIAGLTANHTRYKWQVANVCATDSTAYGDQQDFYTTCTAITMTGKVACYDSEGPVDQLEVNSGTRTCKVQFRYRVTSVTPDTWTTLALGPAITSCHKTNPLSLAASTGYTWEYRYEDECGTTSAWTAGGTNTTDGSGHFTGTCACSGA